MQALVAAMKPGEFRAVGTNTMLDVAPARDKTTWLVQGPFAVMNSWGAAAFDRKRNALVVSGGGHGDYCGNEIYRFRLDTLTWERMTDPSPVEHVGSGVYRIADGSEAPISFHGYDGMQGLPDGRIFVIPAAQCSNGNTYDPFAYLFDPGSRTWKRGAKAPRANTDMGCDWWRNGDRVICSYFNGLLAYDPAANTWQVLQGNEDQATGKTGAIDQERNLFVQVGPNARVAGRDGVAMVYFDLKSPRRTPVPLSGNTDFRDDPPPGIAWHPATGRFVIWSGGPDVWAVDRNWKSTKYTGNGPERLFGFPGVWGKWHYVPALDVFIGARRGGEKVWLYKLPKPGEVAGDSTPPPLFTPSQVVAAARDGQTIELPKGVFRDAFVITANNVTIRGYGTTVTDKSAEGGVAAVISRGRNVRIEGLRVRDARGDSATACFAVMSGSATLVEVDAEGCPQGLRTGRGDITVGIHASRFGPTRAAGQLQHNYYVDQIEKLTVEDSQIIGCASYGHVLKSRSKVTEIRRSTLAMLGHACSRAIDLSQGGRNVIAENLIEVGRDTDNADIMGFGREAGWEIFKEWPGETIVEKNTIVIDWNNPAYVPGPHWASFIVATVGYGQSSHRAILRNNRIVGPGEPWRVQLAAVPPGNRPAEDGGGNIFLPNRAAAGMGPYPSLK